MSSLSSRNQFLALVFKTYKIGDIEVFWSYAILFDFLTFCQIFFQGLQFLVINILSDMGGYSKDSWILYLDLLLRNTMAAKLLHLKMMIGFWFGVICVKYPPFLLRIIYIDFIVSTKLVHQVISF